MKRFLAVSKFDADAKLKIISKKSFKKYVRNLQTAYF
jgi:hypothetical protein